MLYIDDLATLPTAQGQGYASRLLDYVRRLAQDCHLDGVTLDSGFNRQTAHRLYPNKGFVITALHFVQPA